MKRLAKALKDLRCKSEPPATSSGVVDQPHDAGPDKPIPTLDFQYQDYDSSLERLPAEVRRHILFELDFDCLKALVRASPTFHQQYLHDRRRILCASLELTLGSVSLDAYVLQKVRTRELNTPEHLTRVLETWREHLPHRPSFQLYGIISDDEAAAMVSYYFEIIEPVTRNFVKDIMDNLTSQAGGTTDKADWQNQISNIEWQRSLRATYRFELLCCFTDPTTPGFRDETARDNAECLFYTPKPWESEELLSFHQFVDNVYIRVFNTRMVEERPGDPGFDDQDHLPALLEAFQVSDLWEPRDRLVESAVQGGLDLLHEVMVFENLSPYSPKDLVTAIQGSIVSSDIPMEAYSRDGILGHLQVMNRLQHVESGCAGDPALFPFPGDDLCQQPLAWTELWHNWYNPMIPGCMLGDMRGWGYVFWDEDRMERVGIRRLVRSGRQAAGMRPEGRSSQTGTD